jgi:hypothetical protein
MPLNILTPSLLMPRIFPCVVSTSTNSSVLITDEKAKFGIDEAAVASDNLDKKSLLLSRSIGINSKYNTNGGTACSSSIKAIKSKESSSIGTVLPGFT